MRRGLLVLVPTVTVGLIAAVVALAAHQGDSAFVAEQQHPSRIEPRQLELVIENTREPVPSGRGTPAVGARCAPGHNGPKLNPWRCSVRYRSGHTIAYRIEVAPNGRFQGADRTGQFVVSGCCITGGAGPAA